MEYIHVEKEPFGFERGEVLKCFQKNVLRQLFGIFLIADDAGNQGKYLLAVLIQEVFVQSSFSFQDTLDNMFFVILHFVF